MVTDTYGHVGCMEVCQSKCAWTRKVCKGTSQATFWWDWWWIHDLPSPRHKYAWDSCWGRVNSINNCWVVPYNRYRVTTIITYIFSLGGKEGKCIMHLSAYGAVCGTPAQPAGGLICPSDIMPAKLPDLHLIRSTKYIHKYVFRGCSWCEMKSSSTQAQGTGKYHVYHTHKEWPPVEMLCIHFPDEPMGVYDPARDSTDEVIHRQ